MKYKVITAEIHARTALHIGSGDGNETTDALIRRDAAGNPIIPGTAIAGVLRSTLTRLAPRLGKTPCLGLHNWEHLTDERKKKPCGCPVCQLLGDLNPQDEENMPVGEQAKATASRLLVFNATLQKKETSSSQIRDGVGIDRVTGAAARAGRVKFDVEVLPKGQVFNLRLELRDTSPEDEALLASGLAEWRAGRAWVGGRVNRGLGAFTLKNLQFKTYGLDKVDDLVAYLGEDEPWKMLAQPQSRWLDNIVKSIRPLKLSDDVKDIHPHIAQTWVQITGILQATGPLLTNDALGSTLTGFDHAPLLARWGDWGIPIVSGAGLRGVIRSHAERIARTLATHRAKNEDDFLRICPACNPVESRGDAPLASCDKLLKDAKVSANDEVRDVQLCLACQLFGSPRRGSRLVVEDAPYDKTAAGGKPKLKMLDFLAIDRFTGGGADKFKFDALALWRPAFKLRIFLENPELWELGWLALVLRDMQEGWLHVGMGAAKGFGQVKLKDLQFTLGYLHETDRDALGVSGDGIRNGSLYHELPLSPQQSWVDAFRKMQVERKAKPNYLPPLFTDSYFGKVDHLYEVKP